MNSPLHHEALRFLVAGAINTAATYLLYLALLPLLNYTLAYTITYIGGIALAYLLSTKYVFQVRRSARGLALFPLVYVAQYLAGVLVLRVAVETFAVPQKFALLFSIAATIPMTFLLSRWLLKRRDASAAESSVGAGHD
jgi:putative flippase GtrA